METTLGSAGSPPPSPGRAFTFRRGLRFPRDPLGQLLRSGLAIPLLERLVRDLSFHEELCEFASLSLTLERHFSDRVSRCEANGRTDYTGNRLQTPRRVGIALPFFGNGRLSASETPLRILLAIVLGVLLWQISHQLLLVGAFARRRVCNGNARSRRRHTACPLRCVDARRAASSSPHCELPAAYCELRNGEA